MIYRLGLVWGCCALALAACTKPHQGGTLPPARPSASAVASPTPSPTHSSTPAGDKAAIVALAKQYYAESNAAIRTGDTSGLRALMIDGCPCAKFADHVDADWKRGTVPVPGYYRVSQVSAPVLRSSTSGYTTVIYSTSEYKVVAKSGAVLADVPANSSLRTTVLDAQQVDGAWRVANVVRL